MTCGVVMLQYYVFNMSSQIWTLLHNACMRSRRIVGNKTTHHFLNVKDKFIKCFKHSIQFNERSRVTYEKIPVEVNGSQQAHM